MRAISKIPPAFRHHGCKASIAPWIVSHFPRSIISYCEPFCGTAAVFFNLPGAPDYAILNDRSGNICNFFRVHRRAGRALKRALELTPYSRDELEICDHISPELPPLERARRFAARSLMSMSYSSPGKASFRFLERNQEGGFRPPRILHRTDHFDFLVSRLQDAQIENRDYREVLGRLKYPDTVVYLDPEYPEEVIGSAAGKQYDHPFHRKEQHEELIEMVLSHPSVIVLSSYPNALYDDRLLSRGWRRFTKQTRDRRKRKRIEALYINSAGLLRMPEPELFGGCGNGAM